MAAVPSLLQIVRGLCRALIQRVSGGLLYWSRLGLAPGRLPVAARMALLPVAAVPLAAVAALTVAQASQPSVALTKPLALPPAEPVRSAVGFRVDEFAHLLESVFGLDDERALLFADWILEASTRQQLPPDVIASLVYTESSFRKRVRSWAGAIGPAQVMPQYWREFCGGFDLLDPEQNIYCGAQVLAHYKAQCGDLQCALRLYNVGPGNLRLPRYQQASSRYLARIESSRLRFAEHTVL